MIRYKTNEERLWDRIDKSSGCWVWTGNHYSNGYGMAYWERKQRLVHRLIYELLIGPIPEGKTLDHLCRVRDCCNPNHLEPVSQRDNLLRGEGVCARHARQIHCKRGHEFTSKNTGFDNRGHRFCQRCKKMHNEKNNRRYALAAKKAKAKKRQNNLSLGLPGGKQTPPPKVERKRVVRTGRQKTGRLLDSPGGPV